jgi:glycosyltransferase involved in cell wall biosynthesis
MSNIDPAADIHARLAMAEAALRSIGQTIAPEIRQLDIAVLIPCFNEAPTIADVIKSFRAALPQARVYVYDNNSHDNTASIARAAGAIVRREPLQGKHNVVRRMFSDIEADVYILTNADGSHDAAAAPRLVSRMIQSQADMVIGGRVTSEKSAYPVERRPGDRTLAHLAGHILGERFNDMLSDYRAFSRRYIKSYPARSTHVDCELAFSVHALELGMITAEIQTVCAEQAKDAIPRRQPLHEAAHNAVAIARLLRDHRPVALFAAASAGCALGAMLTASGSLMGALAAVALATGVLLGAVNAGRREMKRFAFNGQEGLAARLERYAETRISMDGLRAQALAENAMREVPAPRRSRIN